MWNIDAGTVITLSLISIFLAIILNLKNIISALGNFIFYYNRIGKIEKTYSRAINFIEKSLPDVLYFIVPKLPKEIIVDIDKKTISSALMTYVKKGVKKLRGKKFSSIIIVDDMDYPHQVSYIIRKVFMEALGLENVLGVEFRESIIDYYAYKFAFICGDIVSKDVINILEKRFQASKYRDIIAALDSITLEEKITLNPPPEVKPLLDRVVIPILMLKDWEISSGYVNGLGSIELERSKMEKILGLLANGLIGVIFIGRKNPEIYLDYIKEKAQGFKGILVCCRGGYAKIYNELLHKKFVMLFTEITGLDIVEERFEGQLTISDSDNEKSIYHLYVLLIDKNLI